MANVDKDLKQQELCLAQPYGKTSGYSYIPCNLPLLFVYAPNNVHTCAISTWFRPALVITLKLETTRLSISSRMNKSSHSRNEYWTAMKISEQNQSSRGQIQVPVHALTVISKAIFFSSLYRIFFSIKILQWNSNSKQVKPVLPLLENGW